MSVFERYIEVRKTLKITQGEVSNALKITQGALSQQEKLRNVPIGALEYIRKTYNVNMNWVFSGDGEMIEKEQSTSSEAQEWKNKYDKIELELVQINKELLTIYRKNNELEIENKKLKGL